MRSILFTLTLLAGATTFGTAFAQDAQTEDTPPAETEAPAAEAPTAEAPAGDPTLSLGEVDEELKVGQAYLKDTHGDWQFRCIKAPEGTKDPCQLYQLLNDPQGNSVAEISLFALNGQEGAAAGANIVTPLETLLTQQLRLSVDGGKAKRYPFTWCSQVGCFSRVGFTPADITAFKRGAAAKMTIVPFAAPDQTVDLQISLKGFTAGYDAMIAYGGN